LHFERGVSTFPLPQQALYLTPLSELRFIYGHGKGATINIGEHVGSGGTPCYADMNELLGKHTAILGSTGAGKSGAVAAILHSLLERGSDMDSWMPRIIILDPHNEYGAAFPSHKRLSTGEDSLSLPYWLLNLQETILLIVGKKESGATSQANIVKEALWGARKEGAIKLELDVDEITIDSPIPYDFQSFKSMIETERDKLTPSKQGSYNSILNKIEILQNDTRKSFLMSHWDNTSDPFPNVISQFIGEGKPVRIVDLSGVPNEVAGVTSAVIARTLFNFKLWQTSKERESDPTLLVCEEAHRYVPNRGEAQYEAAQEAIRRIAKEGRKYGLGLILVSQRPSEVEATVLSQCNTWIVLRITNDTDREHVRSILPDSLAGLTKVLSGLRRQEAIFTGQAAMLPSRILIRSLEREQLPRKIREIATRWRLQQKPTVK
jgi:DNA helicase HerA-like ATPase